MTSDAIQLIRETLEASKTSMPRHQVIAEALTALQTLSPAASVPERAGVDALYEITDRLIVETFGPPDDGMYNVDSGNIQSLVARVFEAFGAPAPEPAEGGGEIVRLKTGLQRAKQLLQTLIENDPMEYVADGGVTVLDVWRKDANAFITINSPLEEAVQPETAEGIVHVDTDLDKAYITNDSPYGGRWSLMSFLGARQVYITASGPPAPPADNEGKTP